VSSPEANGGCRAWRRRAAAGLLGARRIAVVHNHPGGVSSPSREDVGSLGRVRLAAASLGIDDVRGLVVARDGWHDVDTGIGESWPELAGDEPVVRPPEVASVRLTHYALGQPMSSPSDLAQVARGLYDPGDRTLIAVLLDSRLRVVGAHGLGAGLAHPDAEILRSFSHLLVGHSATYVGLIASSNGDAWSGNMKSDLVSSWHGALSSLADTVGVQFLDVIVAGKNFWESRTERTSGSFPSHASETPATKSRLVLKARFAAPPEPAGQIELGKTKRGKPVFASGAESGGYNDADHADAAQLHAMAHLHHDQKAGAHGRSSTDDDDWRRAEQHRGERDRHASLADHHLDLVAQHLTAAGRASEAALTVDGGAPGLGTATPSDEAGRKKAREALGARTQHDHPGGVSEADRAAYRAFGEADGAGTDDNGRGKKRPRAVSPDAGGRPAAG
jgi:hypothetical protein